jgi:ABC-type multidrug transport system ATPase subunit
MPPTHDARKEARAPVGISLRALSLHLARSAAGGGGGSVKPAAERSVILDSLSGAVPPGSLFVLLGASGSGKSSLLNALALRLRGAAFRLSGAAAAGALVGRGPA